MSIPYNYKALSMRIKSYSIKSFLIGKIRDYVLRKELKYEKKSIFNQFNQNNSLKVKYKY